MDLLDEVILKNGTKGVIVEFDKASPMGYDICIRLSIGMGETVRNWVRHDDIAAFDVDSDRTAADYANSPANVTEL